MRLFGTGVALAVLAVAAGRSAAQTVDQHWDDELQCFGTGLGTLLSAAPAGQEFKPVHSNLVAIELPLRSWNSPGDDTITVEIRARDLAGPVVASVSLHLPGERGVPDWRRFDLPRPVRLVPGDTYVIAPSATNLSFAWARTDTFGGRCDYERGAGFIQGERETIDWRFRTLVDAGSSPRIETHPQDVRACVGFRATFSVGVVGEGPFTFRWRRDGVRLADGDGVSGAHSASLILDPIRVGDFGAYDVVVGNAGGALVSAPAELSLGESTAPDVPVFVSWDELNRAGEPASFVAVAVDPDGDSILYRFSWGDGTASTSEPVTSGDPVTMTHVFDESGAYPVRVRASDVCASASPFSEPVVADVADVALRAGNVNADVAGVPTDVLFVNRGVGVGAGRVVEMRAVEPFVVALRPAPAGPAYAQAKYAVFVWPARPNSATDAELPFGVGRMGHHLRPSGVSPRAAIVASTLRRPAPRTIPPFGLETPLPGRVIVAPGGTFAPGLTLYVQGVLRDASDTSALGLSVTNGVEVSVVE